MPALTQKVDPHEFTHGIAVVNGVFHSLVGQAEPALQQVHPQHSLDLNGRTASFPTGVVRHYQGYPLVPRDDLIHDFQKFFPLRFLLAAKCRKRACVAETRYVADALVDITLIAHESLEKVWMRAASCLFFIALPFMIAGLPIGSTIWSTVFVAPICCGNSTASRKTTRNRSGRPTFQNFSWT